MCEWGPSAGITCVARSLHGSGAGQLSLFYDNGLMRWTVETLNAAVDAEIAALPTDMRARLTRLSNTIEEVGFSGLPRGAVKHLEDKL
jgi:ABC-type taurine transport system ATPase subunit